MGTRGTGHRNSSGSGGKRTEGHGIRFNSNGGACGCCGCTASMFVCDLYQGGRWVAYDADNDEHWTVTLQENEVNSDCSEITINYTINCHANDGGGNGPTTHSQSFSTTKALPEDGSPVCWFVDHRGVNLGTCGQFGVIQFAAKKEGGNDTPLSECCNGCNGTQMINRPPDFNIGSGMFSETIGLGTSAASWGTNSDNNGNAWTPEGVVDEWFIQVSFQSKDMSNIAPQKSIQTAQINVNLSAAPNATIEMYQQGGHVSQGGEIQITSDVFSPPIVFPYPANAFADKQYILRIDVDDGPFGVTTYSLDGEVLHTTEPNPADHVTPCFPSAGASWSPGTYNLAGESFDLTVEVGF